MKPMYYRVAWKARQSEESSAWMWKSTALSSRSAVYGFLQLFRGAVDPNRFRIFTSASRESLDEELTRENAGRESTAAMIGVFMGYRLTGVSERIGTSPAPEEYVTTVQSILAGIPSRAEAAGHAMGLPLGTVTTIADQRRLEIERGPGGDADIPFTFIPPATLRQRLAWARLLTRIRRGELTP